MEVLLGGGEPVRWCQGYDKPRLQDEYSDPEHRGALNDGKYGLGTCKDIRGLWVVLVVLNLLQ